MGKSTLSRSETIECLNDIQEMSDTGIATMDYDFLRIVASSAHNHILRLRSDLEKRKPKANPKLTGNLPIDTDKIMEWINFEIAKQFPDGVKEYVDGRRSVLELLARRIEQGVFAPYPSPTKGTRQSLHNTIDVMSDQQINTLATSLGLEVSHD